MHPLVHRMGSNQHAVVRCAECGEQRVIHGSVWPTDLKVQHADDCATPDDTSVGYQLEDYTS